MNPPDSAISVHPLTPDRWPDLVALFGPRGATDGCWCMWFRQSSAEYSAGRGESNREAMGAIVARGDIPGLIAYVDGKPAGWVAVQPREALPRLDRSRLTKAIDAEPAWAVVCFFIGAAYRGSGLGAALLAAAVDHAAAHGAKVIEGYPVDPESPKKDATSGFHGYASTFLAAGFVEVARRAKERPFMRRQLL